MMTPIAILALAMGVGGASASAQSKWEEANKAVGAIGGWRTYAKERAAPPEGYPTIPAEPEALLPPEVLAAELSIETAAQLSAWESRRYAERSAALEPPTLSYSRTRGDAESSYEVGVHLPVGSWIGRSRSLAADEEVWGASERRVLELQAARQRLIAYADAVTAKAELARAMDRLEVQALLEELTRRQRAIGAVPEFELLDLQIERTDAQEAEANAREAALRAAERLALEMRLELSGAPELQRRLPLDLAPPQSLPGLGEEGRLDVRMAEDRLSQGQSTVSRARTGLWLGGLELGVLQERIDSGEMNDTVELSWRLPFGGGAAREVDLGERLVRERTAQLRSVQQTAEREIAEATRAQQISARRLEQSEEALNAAETWMEEQIYRYAGMLIGPHDILRAAARLRQVQSRQLSARRLAFVAAVDAHFVRVIPAQPPAPAPGAMPAAAPEAMH
jgi:outer membrane protein TolC